MILERLKEIVAEQLEIDAETITAETRLNEDLNADSLDVVEMLMSLEEEFNITVPEDEAVNIKTVGDIIALIESKQ